MYLIDCKNNLKSQHVKDFINRVNDRNSTVYLVLENDDTHLFEATIDNIRSLFENQDVCNCIVSPEQQIDIIANDVDLRFKGVDYLWYAKPVRGKQFKRVEKLFEAKPVITRKIDSYKIAIGIMRDNKIIDVTTFEGSQKEAITFINKYITLYTLRSFNTADIKCCINWSIDSELDDTNSWQALNDLINSGVFSI